MSFFNLIILIDFSGSLSKPKPFHYFAIHKKKFNKAPRKKKIRAFKHDPRHPNGQKVHFQDYLQLFSSLRECKPNAPINKLYQPSKFRPPEDSFFYKEHSVQSLPDMFTVTEFSDPMVPSREEIVTEMDNLPEEPSLPRTALQLSQIAVSLLMVLHTGRCLTEQFCTVQNYSQVWKWFEATCKSNIFIWLCIFT